MAKTAATRASALGSISVQVFKIWMVWDVNFQAPTCFGHDVVTIEP